MDGKNIRQVIEPLNHEDFADFLSERNFHEEVLLFVSQRVSGAVLLKLSEEDLRELIPIIAIEL